MSAKKGLQKHGDRAAAAILREFVQLHDMKVFEGICKTKLTPSQIRSALRLVTVIKEKRDGSLKGRTCADGRPQRAYIPKEETSSPAVAVENLLATFAIDALEDRNVATADVSGAFLHGVMDDFVLVRLSEEEAQALMTVDPGYKKFAVVEKGRITMFLRLKKALYGTLKVALIWYRTFTEVLENLGFVLNRYDKITVWRIWRSRGAKLRYYGMWMTRKCLIRIQRW